jgi:hypothetical protein
MIASLLHTVVGLLGILLLYLAFFLGETDEGNLQNRLEELWIRVNDLSKTALSKQAAFLQQVSGLLSFGFDRLFGTRLLSAMAIATSICFSVAGFLLLWEIVDPSFLVALIVCAALLIGLAPGPLRYLGFLWIPGIAVGIAYIDRVNISSWSVRDIAEWFLDDPDYVLLPWAALVGSVISDIIFVATTRWCLRRSSRLRSTLAIISLLTVNGCVGVLLFVCPIILGASLNPKRHTFLDHSATSLLVLAARGASSDS